MSDLDKAVEFMCKLMGLAPKAQPLYIRIDDDQANRSRADRRDYCGHGDDYADDKAGWR